MRHCCSRRRTSRLHHRAVRWHTSCPTHTRTTVSSSRDGSILSTAVFPLETPVIDLRNLQLVVCFVAPPFASLALPASLLPMCDSPMVDVLAEYWLRPRRARGRSGLRSSGASCESPLRLSQSCLVQGSGPPCEVLHASLLLDHGWSCCPLLRSFGALALPFRRRPKFGRADL